MDCFQLAVNYLPCGIKIRLLSVCCTGSTRIVLVLSQKSHYFFWGGLSCRSEELYPCPSSGGGVDDSSLCEPLSAHNATRTGVLNLVSSNWLGFFSWKNFLSFQEVIFVLKIGSSKHLWLSVGNAQFWFVTRLPQQQCSTFRHSAASVCYARGREPCPPPGRSDILPWDAGRSPRRPWGNLRRSSKGFTATWKQRQGSWAERDRGSPRLRAWGWDCRSGSSAR